MWFFHLPYSGHVVGVEGLNMFLKIADYFFLVEPKSESQISCCIKMRFSSPTAHVPLYTARISNISVSKNVSNSGVVAHETLWLDADKFQKVFCKAFIMDLPMLMCLLLKKYMGFL